ncbi:hypothetical protein RCL1_006134 [Eukaryota sp. TZLM3-RCL]
MNIPSRLVTTTANNPSKVVDKNTLAYHHNGSRNSPVGTLLADFTVPLDVFVYYFEVTILDPGLFSYIGIGFVPRNYPENAQPGWKPDSFAYHCDDGYVYHQSGKGQQQGFPITKSYDAVIGIGIIIPNQHIFLTKNGVLLGFFDFTVPSNLLIQGLYPAIGLHSEGEKVQVNFGPKFCFDLDHFSVVCRSEILADLIGNPELFSTADARKQSNLIVFDYLFSKCHVKTLEKFLQHTRFNSEQQQFILTIVLKRIEVKELILGSNSAIVLNDITNNFPQIFEPKFQVILFRLRLQVFLDLILVDDLNALEFAKTELHEWDKFIKNDENLPKLSEVLGILAYNDPLNSPFSGFFDYSVRQETSDLLDNFLRQICFNSIDSTCCLLESTIKQFSLLISNVLSPFSKVKNYVAE